jgi:hypothetical protein
MIKLTWHFTTNSENLHGVQLKLENAALVSSSPKHTRT